MSGLRSAVLLLPRLSGAFLLLLCAYFGSAQLNPNIRTTTTYFPLINGNTGSFVSYVVTANGRTVTVPGRVSAFITPDMVGNPRTSFSATVAIEDRMNAMMRRVTDERGHIIGSQLGGLPIAVNVFPQSPNFNRNVGTTDSLLQTWNTIENAVAAYVRNGHGYALMMIEFFYDNGAEPFRPSSVRLRVDFYDINWVASTTDPGYDCIFSNEDAQPICVPRNRAPLPTTTTTTPAPTLPAPNPGLTGVLGWTLGAAAAYQCGRNSASG